MICFLAVTFPATATIDPAALVVAARQQIGVTLGYDPAYRRIAYPQGDVAETTGVCSDVVIRALRRQGLDLQKRVHEDMLGHFAAYPKGWGLKRPDSNIDHRRVPNLMTWFDRQGMALPLETSVDAYRPGDIVTWNLGRGQTHIGLVSDRRSAQGTPLILHNIGRGTREEDILFRFEMTGHYRFPGA
ncbi:DUF1287 domain-containing protein [Pseudomonas sp. RIT-PI-AD]|uniref:DUF1287 domain-containing protein n=1 Tax=Pseudomonas sp. RIT-PI-AD TaxID=3035294 RepID=UPI0021DB17E9|nr:DUF1287 domain-containing protein [Pseudomonas sp. RIT-PI-AD]